MRLRISLLCAFLLVPICLAGTGSAAPRMPRFAGVTVVTGSRSAWTTVHLPFAVSYAYPGAQKHGQVEVTGRGRVFGVEMVGIGSARGGHLEAMRYNFCFTAGCVGQHPEYVDDVQMTDPSTGQPNTDGPITLRPGDYRLLLITDGAPVRVTFRFTGHSGHATVRPSRAVSVVQRTVTMTPEAVPASWGVTALSGDVNYTWRRPGRYLDMLEVRRPGSVHENAGSCYYPADSPPNAYVMSCPGGHTNFGDEERTASAGVAHFLGGWGLMQPGAYALGEYYTSVGATESARVGIAFLTYPSGW